VSMKTADDAYVAGDACLNDGVALNAESYGGGFFPGWTRADGAMATVTRMVVAPCRYVCKTPFAAGSSNLHI
jgi:hypothetical protein